MEHTSKSLDENLHIGLETDNKVLFNMKYGCVLSCVGCHKRTKAMVVGGAKAGVSALIYQNSANSSLIRVVVSDCGGTWLCACDGMFLRWLAQPTKTKRA